jgi:hypothetical protein
VQPSPQDGPWAASRQPIQQLVRGLHQCLVAEIAFDPDPIPNGATTGTSDKLAQRNLAIVESDNPGSVASHTIQHTFEMRPTRTTLQPNEKPDELMIVWGSTPHGSVATLYLPGVRTAEILDWAGRMYETTLLERVDDHTLRVRTGEVTHIPIPSGTGPSFAGLLTVELPPDVRHGNVFTIVVRQITTEKIVIRPPVPREQMRALLASTRAGAAETSAVSRMNRGTFAASELPPLQERRVLGSFQITVPVRSRKEIVGREERALTVVRSILRAMPRENRWYLAFERYVEQIGQRVEALGGNAGGGPPDRGSHGDGGETGSDHRGCIGLLFDLLFGRRGRR